MNRGNERSSTYIAVIYYTNRIISVSYRIFKDGRKLICVYCTVLVIGSRNVVNHKIIMTMLFIIVVGSGTIKVLWKKINGI